MSLDVEFSAVPLPQERRLVVALSSGQDVPGDVVPDAVSVVGSCREHGSGLCAHSVALVDGVDLTDPDVLWVLLGYGAACDEIVQRLSPEDESSLRAGLLARLHSSEETLSFAAQWEKLNASVPAPPALERAYREGDSFGDL